MAHELTYDNVVEVLLARVPELQPTYQKLLNERGEPLTDEERNEWLVEGVEELLDEEGRLPFPKYFFAAEAAWFAEKLAARAPNDPAAADTLRRLAAVLEEMATSKDPYLPEMLAAGFVEVLNPDAPGFHYLVGLMGPPSRAEVEPAFGVDSV